MFDKPKFRIFVRMENKDFTDKLPDISSLKEIKFPEKYGSGSSFVGGDKGNDRLDIKYFIDGNRKFFATVRFGFRAQGPPGHVHGGAMAAVLDETLGLAAWVAGYPIVSANLNITYINMLPVGKEVVVSTFIENVEDKKVHVSGFLSDKEGKIYTKAKLLCIIRPVEKIGSDGFMEFIEAQLS